MTESTEQVDLSSVEGAIEQLQTNESEDKTNKSSTTVTGENVQLDLETQVADVSLNLNADESGHAKHSIKETKLDKLQHIKLQDNKTDTFSSFLKSEESSVSVTETKELTQRDGHSDELNLNNTKKLVKPASLRKLSKKKSSFVSEVQVAEDNDDDDDVDDWVWVEEEVDEEIEVEEIDEESDAHESAEEETDYEEILEEEIEEDITEEHDEETEGIELEDEEVEDKVLEQEDEEQKEIDEELPEEILEEQMEEILEEEIIEIEETSEQEVSEKEPVVEKYQHEEMEEEMSEEESVEEEIEEVSKKKKRKFKIIKVMKMVRKRKKDVIKALQNKVAPVEEVLQMDEEEIELKEITVKDEFSKRERERMFDMVKLLASQIVTIQRRNKLLSKSIVDYYKQKKLDNVQQTETPNPEVYKKYYKRLKLYQEAKLTAAAEIDRMLNNVESTKDELSCIVKEYDKEKAELLVWETEVARNVIKAQTGRPLEESEIKHITQRHELLLKQLSEELYNLILLQTDMSSIEAKIKKLVALEGELNLIDFEQLKMDNHMFSDKLEERENELGHLRKNILEIIHTHAHVLEKSDSVTEDIENCNAKHHYLQQEVMQLREAVNKLKNKRDKLRNNTAKMRRNAGLLIRPRLANDYEETLYKIEAARLKLDSLKMTFNKQKATIDKLRKDIADATTYNIFYNDSRQYANNYQ